VAVLRVEVLLRGNGSEKESRSEDRIRGDVKRIVYNSLWGGKVKVWIHSAR
jgi:hypothetical protein